MKRIAAFAAAALVVAGCGPGPQPVPFFTDLTLYWQFVDQDGNRFGNFTGANPGCVDANVDDVVVTLIGPGGRTVWTVPCVASNGIPGATFPQVPTGSYTWTVEGWRAGLAVFSMTGGGQVFDFPFFDTAPLAIFPNMDLFYDLPSGVGCTGIFQISFQLDNITVPSSPVVEYSSLNAFIPCGLPPNNGFTMPSIPLGNYGYRFIAAVDAPPPRGRSLYQICGFGLPPDRPIVQVAGGVFVVAPLSLPFGTCP